MGIFSRVDEFLKKAANIASAPSRFGAGLVVGAAKGVMDIPRGAAELGSNIGEFAANTGAGRAIGRAVSSVVSPEAASSARKALDAGVQRTALTTPTSTAEKIGYGAEKLGEFFVPGAASTKAMTTMSKLFNSSKAAKLAGTTAKVATEATGAGVVSSLQSGGDMEEARNTAVLSGLATLAAPAAMKVATWLNKKVAPRVINSLVKPSNKEFEFGKDAGKAILDENLRAPTAGSLLTKVTDKKQEIGKMIDSALEGVDDMVDVTPAINKLDDLVMDANTAGERELAEKYRAIKEGLTGVFDPATGAKIGERNLTNLTAKEAQELKIKIGNAVQWYNTPFEGQTNQARVAVYRAINDIIDTVAPGSKALNMRYANMLTAQTALMRRINNIERSNLGGLLANLAGAATTLAGYAGGGIGLDDIARGLAAWGVAKFAGSTAGRTLVEAPLVQATAGAIKAGATVRAPLAGFAAKVYDAVFGENDDSPIEQREKYEKFIDEARARGISEEQIKEYLEQKKASEPVEGAF